MEVGVEYVWLSVLCFGGCCVWKKSGALELGFRAVCMGVCMGGTVWNVMRL